MVAGGRELIDTLWNVNFFKLTAMGTVLLELIDTLWNVNPEIPAGKYTASHELIDTLWNVNIICDSAEPKTIRINRYIMECK